jgi:hypothetical protein
MSQSALDADPSDDLSFPSTVKIVGRDVNKLTPDWTAVA